MRSTALYHVQTVVLYTTSIVANPSTHGPRQSPGVSYTDVLYSTRDLANIKKTCLRFIFNIWNSTCQRFRTRDFVDNPLEKKTQFHGGGGALSTPENVLQNSMPRESSSSDLFSDLFFGDTLFYRSNIDNAGSLSTVNARLLFAFLGASKLL